MGRWEKPKERTTPGQFVLPGFDGLRPERPRIQTMPVAAGVAVESREAAEAAQHSAAGDRELILALVRGRGDRGATCDEVSAATGRAPNEISGRFTELNRLQLILRSGERRPTRAGNSAAVWVAAVR